MNTTRRMSTNLSWETEKLEALTRTAVSAVRRSRYVFATIQVTGVAMLASQFNATIPWLRNAIERIDRAQRVIPGVYSDLKELISDEIWRDLNVVAFPIVGIKFSVYDMSVIGAVTMSVLGQWLFFAMRRENHSIRSVVGEARTALAAGRRPRQGDAPVEKAKYLYYSVAHYFVFTTITQIDSLDGNPERRASFSVRVLLFMPFWIPLLAVSVDVLSLCLVPPVRTLEGRALWFQLTGPQQVEAGLRVAFCLALCAVNVELCRRCLNFDREARAWLNTLAGVLGLTARPNVDFTGIQVEALDAEQRPVPT
jgi:hypothetical protein